MTEHTIRDFISLEAAAAAGVTAESHVTKTWRARTRIAGHHKRSTQDCKVEVETPARKVRVFKGHYVCELERNITYNVTAIRVNITLHIEVSETEVILAKDETWEATREESAACAAKDSK